MNRNGEESEVEEVVVLPERMKSLGIQEVGPSPADKREGRKGGVRDSREAF